MARRRAGPAVNAGAAFVYLASRSPRRRELLRQIGIAFEVVEASVDEGPLPGEGARELVARLARAKAERGARAAGARRPAPVLGADTVVALDGAIFGKPADRTEAEGMLATLSGRCHRVLSAVALHWQGGTRLRVSESEVCLRGIGAGERRRYCEGGEPLDKAGAYGLQGLGATFVARLSGSPSGVMGLPLLETAELLAGAGIDVLEGASPAASAVQGRG